MKLRILQIMNRVPWPLKDGGSLGYYQFIKGYHLAGCEVTVCALNTSKHYVDMQNMPVALSDIAQWHSTPIQTDLSASGALKNLLFSRQSYNTQRFFSDEFLLTLKELLQKQSFDVVIFESLFMAQYLPFVKGYSKALMILREHNVEYKIWETLSQLEKNPIKKWYLQLLSKRMYDEEKTALNAFDALTTVTKEDKQELQKMGCNKLIHVAPFCIDVDALKMMPSSDANVQSVFHIGSMEWMPNCEAMKWFLEKVWPRVTDKIATAHFYMAGRGMPASFHQYNSESVHVVGEVEDAYEFMSKHQVMIVPLFSGSGIRVKILEAMALGKSIVSTNLGMAGIDCISSVHACLANNADEFAQAIIDLLSYNEKSKQMGLEAQKLIQEKYTLSKVISQTLDFYQMVASSSGK